MGGTDHSQRQLAAYLDCLVVLLPVIGNQICEIVHIIDREMEIAIGKVFLSQMRPTGYKCQELRNYLSVL